MIRDIDLQRKILLAIEEQYKPGDMVIFELSIEGYDMATVGEHCQILAQDELVNLYDPTYVLTGLDTFSVGNLTSKGYDFLEQIRDEKNWERIKAKADEKELPKTVSNLSKIAGIIMGNIINEISGK